MIYNIHYENNYILRYLNLTLTPNVIVQRQAGCTAVTQLRLRLNKLHSNAFSLIALFD